MKRSVWIQMAAALLLLAGGCMLDKPGSGSLASIVIEETPLAQVRSVLLQVFAEEDYNVARTSERQIVFEREGTRHDRAKYGRYEERLVMRVIVTLELYKESGILLCADAYAVRGESGRAQKLLYMDHWAYQRLLNRVQEKIPVAADVKEE